MFEGSESFKHLWVAWLFSLFEWLNDWWDNNGDTLTEEIASALSSSSVLNLNGVFIISTFSWMPISVFIWADEFIKEDGEFLELFVEKEFDEHDEEFRRSFDLGATGRLDKLEGQYLLLFFLFEMICEIKWSKYAN